MDLWMDASLIVLLALVIDAAIGDPPNAIHPLRWMGNILGWIDRHTKRKSPRGTKVKGFLAYLLIAFIFIFISFLILASVRFFIDETWGEIIWIVVSAFLFKLTFAIFSFRKHCKPIQRDLINGDVEAAAAKTQMIVSRNTKGMDAEHISSSCVESTAENFADSVCSPGLYFGLFGLFGAIMFRCANMMDAMWGYLNDKYRDLGFFPAKFDDVLGYVTSRISILFISLAAALMRMDRHSAMRTAFAEHGKTPSPNSGWPMTAVAGAMGIRMEKNGEYVMGEGPLPTPEDIGKGYRLVELSSILYILMVTLPLYVILGVHIQLFIEDSIIHYLEVLF